MSPVLRMPIWAAMTARRSPAFTPMLVAAWRGTTASLLGVGPDVSDAYRPNSSIAPKSPRSTTRPESNPSSV